jgi:hypothetical protein
MWTVTCAFPILEAVLAGGLLGRALPEERSTKMHITASTVKELRVALWTMRSKSIESDQSYAASNDANAFDSRARVSIIDEFSCVLVSGQFNQRADVIPACNKA